jgi:hypothetical protein
MMLLVVSFATSMLFLGMKLIYLQNLHRLFESSFEGVLEFLRRDIAPQMALRVLNMGTPMVNKDELRIRMKSVGFNAPDSDINRIFARLDTRHRGRVVMKQFCDALEARMGSRRPSALQSLMGELFAEARSTFARMTSLRRSKLAGLACRLLPAYWHIDFRSP